MRRITIIIEDEMYENLRLRAYQNSERGVSETVRKILDEVFHVEDKIAHNVIEKPFEKVPFKSLKKSEEEIKKIEDEIDYDPDEYVVHLCEGYGCKSTKTEMVSGEGYDDEGNLKTFSKWLCEFHRKKVK